jgi:hypothetical protein
MTRIILGLFDNRGDAERTVEHLIQEFRVDPAGIEIHGAGGDDSSPEAQHALGQIANSALPAEDRSIFREGIRRNSAVVVAHVKESQADRAMDVFEEYGAADLDARAADWRGAGWVSEPGQTGGTGHDEDIGFATYGEDAVLGHIPRHHHDNTPAGLLGRFAMSAMRPEPERRRARVRSYVVGTKKGRETR